MVEWEAEGHMEKSGQGRNCEGRFEKGICRLPFKVECWR